MISNLLAQYVTKNSQNQLHEKDTNNSTLMESHTAAQSVTVNLRMHPLLSTMTEFIIVKDHSSAQGVKKHL